MGWSSLGLMEINDLQLLPQGFGLYYAVQPFCLSYCQPRRWNIVRRNHPASSVGVKPTWVEVLTLRAYPRKQLT